MTDESPLPWQSELQKLIDRLTAMEARIPATTDNPKVTALETAIAALTEKIEAAAATDLRPQLATLESQVTALSTRLAALTPPTPMPPSPPNGGAGDLPEPSGTPPNARHAREAPPLRARKWLR